jgi:hypothetical protein
MPPRTPPTVTKTYRRPSWSMRSLTQPKDSAKNSNCIRARRPRQCQRLGRPRQRGEGRRRPIAESLSRLHRADLGRHAPERRSDLQRAMPAPSRKACERPGCRRETRRQTKISRPRSAGFHFKGPARGAFASARASAALFLKFRCAPGQDVGAVDQHQSPTGISGLG